MQFNVNGKPFYEQLSAVGKVINAKNALSILDNFLFRVEGDTLYITGSDQENIVTATVDIMEADGNGAVAVPAKKILEVLKEITAHALNIRIDANTYELTIEYQNGRFSFMGIDPAEFPRKEENDDTTEPVRFDVPASEVQRALELTLYAVSAEPIRPMMTGIFWDITPDKITFVSSDTHKLVRYINTESQPGVTASFIMPSKPASILKSLINKDMTDIHVEMDEKGANFTFDRFTLSCRFIKGNYPNYNRVIPKDNPFRLVTDRTSLLGGMRRASLFANKASSLVRLEISANEIKITGQDIDFSTLSEETVACEYTGNDMTIGFNAVYAQEVLANMTCDSIVIELSDPARPGVFMPLVQEENEDLVTIQMPMQVVE